MQYLQQNKEIETKKSTVMDNFIPSFMTTKKVKVFHDAKGGEIDISKIPGCIQCQYVPLFISILMIFLMYFLGLYFLYLMKNYNVLRV